MTLYTGIDALENQVSPHVLLAIPIFELHIFQISSLSRNIQSYPYPTTLIFFKEHHGYAYLNKNIHKTQLKEFTLTLVIAFLVLKVGDYHFVHHIFLYLCIFQYICMTSMIREL